MGDVCSVCFVPPGVHRLIDGKTLCSGARLRTIEQADNVRADNHQRPGGAIMSDQTDQTQSDPSEAPAEKGETNTAPDVAVETDGGDATINTGSDAGEASSDEAEGDDAEGGSSEEE